MSQPGTLLIVFVVLWVVTFFPAWALFLRLLAVSASSNRLTLKFWWLLLLYRFLIALPYIVLLVVGADTLPDIFEIVIVGFILMGLALSVVRFVFKNRIVAWLWWVYGYVYDGLLHYAPYRRLIKRTTALAVKEMPNAHSILELGCGTGNVLAALGTAYPKAYLVGVDNSSSMLRSASKKLHNAEIVRDSALHFLRSCPPDHYNLVVMQNVLYAINDRELLWKQLARVLKKNGVVIITNSDREGSFSITKEHLKYGKWYELLYPKLLCVGLIDAFISQLSRAGSFSFISESVIRNEVKPYFKMSATERVYGDVNILFTLKGRDKNER